MNSSTVFRNNLTYECQSKLKNKKKISKTDYDIYVCICHRNNHPKILNELKNCFSEVKKLSTHSFYILSMSDNFIL